MVKCENVHFLKFNMVQHTVGFFFTDNGILYRYESWSQCYNKHDFTVDEKTVFYSVASLKAIGTPLEPSSPSLLI